MHIHKPKAVASLREFLSEITVIVVGIAIALCGEQVVEWFHWRHELAQVRASLSEELGHDLGVMNFRASQSPCIDARAADLNRFVASWRDGRTPVLAGPVGGPFLYVYSNDAWSVAQSSQALLHMPLQERLAYEHVYKLFRFLEERRLVEGGVWDDIPQFVGARRLDEHDLMKLSVLANKAQNENGFYLFNVSRIDVLAQTLHVRPETLHGNADTVTQLCTPLKIAG